MRRRRRECGGGRRGAGEGGARVGGGGSADRCLIAPSATRRQQDRAAAQRYGSRGCHCHRCWVVTWGPVVVEAPGRWWREATARRRRPTAKGPGPGRAGAGARAARSKAVRGSGRTCAARASKPRRRQWTQGWRAAVCRQLRRGHGGVRTACACTGPMCTRLGALQLRPEVGWGGVGW